MKKAVCKICGSNALLKQNQGYICRMCGTGYSAAEIRNLLLQNVSAQREAAQRKTGKIR